VTSSGSSAAIGAPSGATATKSTASNAVPRSGDPLGACPERYAHGTIKAHTALTPMSFGGRNMRQRIRPAAEECGKKLDG
jgi:hypothetical protein